MINDYEKMVLLKFWIQRLYVLGLNHKHLPEMKYILKKQTKPLFLAPSVGNFKQGMLVMSYIEKKRV